MSLLRRIVVVSVVALLVCCLASDASAFGGRRRGGGGGGGGYMGVPAGHSNLTAQGVANIQAATGRMGHYGGNPGYEGCACAGSPQQALATCCYANSGMPVYDQGVAQGANGMWYACKRYGTMPAGYAARFAPAPSAAVATTAEASEAPATTAEAESQ